MLKKLPLLIVVIALFSSPVFAQEKNEKRKKEPKDRVERDSEEGELEIQRLKRRFIELQKEGASKEELVELRNEIFQSQKRGNERSHDRDHERGREEEHHVHRDHGDREHGDHEHEDHEHGDHEHGDHDDGDHDDEGHHRGHERMERMEHLHLAIRHLQEAGMHELAHQVMRQVERNGRAQRGPGSRGRRVERERPHDPPNQQRSIEELHDRVNMLQRDVDRMKRFIQNEIEEEERRDRHDRGDRERR